MDVFIIKHLATGKIEPSSSRREGVWKSRATALQRIKSHWNVPWSPRLLDETWDEVFARNMRLKAEFRAANPFEEWWPKYFEIITLSNKGA